MSGYVDRGTTRPARPGGLYLVRSLVLKRSSSSDIAWSLIEMSGACETGARTTVGVDVGVGDG